MHSFQINTQHEEYFMRATLKYTNNDRINAFIVFIVHCTCVSFIGVELCSSSLFIMFSAAVAGKGRSGGRSTQSRRGELLRDTSTACLSSR